MHRFLLIGLLGVLAACGTASASDTTSGKGAPEAAASAVAVPTPSPAADGSLTTAQTTAVAEQTFPLIQPYGYYAVCGVDGDLSACPYTPRLKARLAELRATLSRAQNPSATRVVSAELTGPSTGLAHVSLFDGREQLDLSVVLQGGQVLVDDESCTGRADTSIYETLVAC
jgi:hypothetical protein